MNRTNGSSSPELKCEFGQTISFSSPPEPEFGSSSELARDSSGSAPESHSASSFPSSSESMILPVPLLALENIGVPFRVYSTESYQYGSNFLRNGVRWERRDRANWPDALDVCLCTGLLYSTVSKKYIKGSSSYHCTVRVIIRLAEHRNSAGSSPLGSVRP